MKKLEYYILKIFQDMILKNKTQCNQYVCIEDNLLCLIKPEEELDLFIKTELILDGRTLKTFKFTKIIDGLYKVEWTDLFLYLIGNKSKLEINHSTVTKELELIKLSQSPLTNYIKTL